MTISSRCSICKHLEVDTINARLVAGVSPATLADQFGVGKMALHRHKANHLPQVLVRSQHLKEADAADNLLEQVQSIYDKAWDIVNRADSEGKFAPAVGALKECRSCLELIGKLLGEIKSGTTVNILYNPEFIQVRQTITEALRPYPEARLAVVKALDEEAIDGEYTERD